MKKREKINEEEGIYSIFIEINGRENKEGDRKRIEGER